MFVKIPGTFLRKYASTPVEARRMAVQWLEKERVDSHVDIYPTRESTMALGYVQKMYGGKYMYVIYGPPETHLEIYKNGKLKK